MGLLETGARSSARPTAAAAFRSPTLLPRARRAGSRFSFVPCCSSIFRGKRTFLPLPLPAKPADGFPTRVGWGLLQHRVALLSTSKRRSRPRLKSRLLADTPRHVSAPERRRVAETPSSAFPFAFVVGLTATAASPLGGELCALLLGTLPARRRNS